MNIVIKCKVSLSKKLRKLIGKDGKITLITSDLENGCGEGKLLIYSSDSNFDSDEISIDKAETSIMIIPEDIEEARPSSGADGVGNIFSSIPNKGVEEKIVRKIAAVNPPEKNEVPFAVVPREERVCVEPIVREEGFRKFASNMDELMEAVYRAKDKSAGIDLDSISDPRKRAIAIEEKEKREAIDIGAWVVNTKCGKLEVADLGITLLLYMPFDLSRISAKRIAASKDLISLIQNGWVRFLAPSETQSWIDKAISSQKDYSIPVYSNHEDAEDNASANGLDVNHSEMVVARQYGNRIATTSGGQSSRNSMEITAEDLEMPTDEERMIQTLLSGRSGSSEEYGGVRRTSHGSNGSSVNSRPSRSPISLTGSAGRTISGSGGTQEHKSIRRVD